MKIKKSLQKKRSKEEKMKMKHGKLKEKRAEYSARLKVRNTDAWNSMTVEQQNDQKMNRKIQTQLSEDVSALLYVHNFKKLSHEETHTPVIRIELN